MTIQRWFLAAAFVCACSGKKDIPEPAPDPQAPAPSPVADCAKQADELRSWLADLVVDGYAGVFVGASLNLADVDASPQALRADDASTVTVSESEVTMDGQLIQTIAKLNGIDTGIRERAESAVKAGKKHVVIVADAAVRWSAIATVANSVAAAGVEQADFVLHATGKPRAAAPGPSSIDADLDKLASPSGNRAADLAKPGPGLAAKVFCQPVLDLLAKSGGGYDLVDAIVPKLADAVAACDCKQDVPSMRRLVWAWFARDEKGAPHYIARVKLGKSAMLAEKPDATWSASAHLVVDAARNGQPVGFEAK